MNIKLPKKIWIFWYQGLENTPSLVQKCITSWQKRHPNYEVFILDKNSIKGLIDIPSFISIERADISYQKYSNYIRLKLLHQYGGIWVDASVYCFSSLDDWLIDTSLMKTGMFMFSNPNTDRMIGNWFIAATPHHYSITQWLTNYEAYFENNRMDNTYSKNGKRLIKLLSYFFNQNTKKTQYWLSYFVRKGLKIYPYFIQHYLFNQLYYQDKTFKNIWDEVPRLYNCKISLLCTRKSGGNFKTFLLQFKGKEIPLFKLSHRTDFTMPFYQPFMQFIEKDFKQLIQKEENNE
jgi:hypothetical protein